MSTHVKNHVFVINTDIFTKIMSRKSIYSVIGLVIILFSIWIFSDPAAEDENISERVKVTLRNVGHQLLFANQDSTSLVMPVVEVEKTKYRISFQDELSIEPSNLVSIIQKNFEKASISTQYLIEVINCSNNEVAYSYEIKNTDENSIIPCSGRQLERSCYTIEVRFTGYKTIISIQTILMIIAIIVLLIIQFIFYKRKNSQYLIMSNDEYTSIGRFRFYPDQNKLVQEETEIPLSKKECELLSIFLDNLNQVVKRDELTKKVWEDKGVIVGRSLDTYISKLRKKLKSDNSIKLANIHGVGYKLEINQTSNPHQ